MADQTTTPGAVTDEDVAWLRERADEFQSDAAHAESQGEADQFEQMALMARRLLAAVERDRDRVVLQSCSACGHQLDPVEPRITRCVHCDAIAPTLTREQEDEVIRRRVNELADGTDSLCYGKDYFGEALDMPVRDVLVALGVTPPQD